MNPAHGLIPNYNIDLPYPTNICEHRQIESEALPCVNTDYKPQSKKKRKLEEDTSSTARKALILSHYKYEEDYGVFYAVKHFDEGNRKKYEGLWLANKPYKYGVMEYTTGDIYTGEWKDNKRHGEGNFFWKQKRGRSIEYDGTWSAGLMHGIGIIRYSDGTMYRGEWMHGERIRIF